MARVVGFGMRGAPAFVVAALLAGGCATDRPWSGGDAAAGALHYAAGDATGTRYRLLRDGERLVLRDDDDARVLLDVPLAGAESLALHAADGATEDTLTVDFSGGAFALPGGIDYDGGAQGFDTLAVVGGGSESGTHLGHDAHSGTVRVGALEIRYANLEPVTFSNMTSLGVPYTDAAQTITITTGAASGDASWQIASAGFETVTLTNVTNVFVHGGASSADLGDTIVVNLADAPTGLATLTINGDDESSTASGADRIEIAANLLVPSTLNGGQGDDVFAFANGRTVNGTLVGGAGTDVVDYALYTTPVSVNLGTGSTGLSAALTAAQESPPTSTTASGTATFVYDPSDRTFDVTVAVSGIAAPTGFHIHRAPAGTNGPIVIDFGTTVVPDGAGGFTFNASNIPLPATLTEAQFLGGLSYVNVHTAAFPGGAIRGQVVSGGNVNLATGEATGTNAVSGIENVVGGTAADSLVGSFSANTLSGGAGADTLLGGPGADTHTGGNDDDAMVWSNGDGSDVMDGNAGTDTVHVNGGTSADDIMVVADNGARIAFSRTSPGPFTLDIGTTEALGINGHGGNDTFTVNTLANATAGTTFTGFAGNDTFDINGTAYASLRVQGGDGTDTLQGPDAAAAWSIDAPAASTSLAGVVAAANLLESLTGGTGADTFVLGTNAVLAGTIDGGGGTDVLDYSGHALPVSVNLGLNSVGLAATLGADQESPTTTSAGTGTATAAFNPATGTIDVAVVVNDLDPATVTGFHIHRAPVGVNGPIIIDLGGVIVPAGTGFTYNATGLAVPAEHRAALLGGITYVNVHTTTFAGGAIRGQLFSTGNVIGTGAASGVAAVTNVENAIGGSGNDSLVGNSSANALSGAGGNDTLLGGPGADTMAGGAGADVLVWSNGDGSDAMDGDADADIVQVNGSAAAADVFTLDANGARLDFDRVSPGPFSLDVGTVERVIVNGLAGDDDFTPNALAGIANLVQIDLNGFDGADDFLAASVPPAAIAIDAHGHAGADIAFGAPATTLWRIPGDAPASATGQFRALRAIETYSGGAGADEFIVSAPTQVPITVAGGDPTVAPGDVLRYDAEGRTTSGDSTPPDGAISSPGVATVTFVGIETANVVANGIFSDGFED